MTNSITSALTGGVLAVITAGNAATIPDFIGGMAGVCLLVWLVIHIEKELREERENARELQKQLTEQCKNCRLAHTANDMLEDAARDKMNEDCNHERENQGHTKEGRRDR